MISPSRVQGFAFIAVWLLSLFRISRDKQQAIRRQVLTQINRHKVLQGQRRAGRFSLLLPGPALTLIFLRRWGSRRLSTCPIKIIRRPAAFPASKYNLNFIRSNSLHNINISNVSRFGVQPVEEIRAIYQQRSSSAANAEA
ncbi:MAG TPA: hypothetical protein PKD26_03520 [Pyrinomonadaceae bacterium]|nr:hypothetical protein [Pyrinomonadaceae bacterium]